jgi:hypothetical protein
MDAYGANSTKYASPVPSTFMGAEWGGKLRVTHDTYTFASAIAGLTLQVGVLKPGEVYVDGFIHSADLGSATTLILGDAGDTDRFLAATVFTTASQVTACRKAEGLGYKNDTTSDIPLYVTVGVETANGAIEVVIFKACPN